MLKEGEWRGKTSFAAFPLLSAVPPRALLILAVLHAGRGLLFPSPHVSVRKPAMKAT